MGIAARTSMSPVIAAATSADRYSSSRPACIDDGTKGDRHHLNQGVALGAIHTQVVKLRKAVSENRLRQQAPPRDRVLLPAPSTCPPKSPPTIRPILDALALYGHRVGSFRCLGLFGLAPVLLASRGRLRPEVSGFARWRTPLPARKEMVRRPPIWRGQVPAQRHGRSQGMMVASVRVGVFAWRGPLLPAVPARLRWARLWRARLKRHREAWRPWP